ncbi:hypothetical protein FND50_21305 [Rhodococcus sp. WB9]|nr:hypothetical protein FND50_21305 [Rhodococcus sp. WB9]
MFSGVGATKGETAEFLRFCLEPLGQKRFGSLCGASGSRPGAASCSSRPIRWSVPRRRGRRWRG